MHKYTKIACVLAILGYVSTNLLFAPDGGRGMKGRGGPGMHKFGGHFGRPNYDKMIKELEAGIDKVQSTAEKMDATEKLNKIKELHTKIKFMETPVKDQVKKLENDIKPLWEEKHKLIKELRDKLGIKPTFGPRGQRPGFGPEKARPAGAPYGKHRGGPHGGPHRGGPQGPRHGGHYEYHFTPDVEQKAAPAASDAR